MEPVICKSLAGGYIVKLVHIVSPTAYVMFIILFLSWSQSSPQKNNSSDNGSGILSRWLSSHYHGGVHDEKSVARHTVNLLTSTIKVDADQTDLRFCFRIISPSKIYTLQVCFLGCIMWV